MRLSAVVITAAFACGVALGPCQPIAQLATSRAWLAGGFLTSVFLIVVAVALLNRFRFNEAAIVSGVCWIFLGTLGAWISNQLLPGTHIISLVNAERIDLHTPLRWHARLRDEPTKLPWVTSRFQHFMRETR